MNRRAVLIPLAALLVVVACAAVYVFVLSVPAYRTAVVVDTSAPGTGLAQIAGAVRSVTSNSGDSDALSVRRFGGECGSAGNTSEIADSPDEVQQAVGSLSPSGKATMVDGVAAAIDGFSGLLTRRGSVRNRIVVISTSGADACTNDPAGARKALDDRLAEAGLDLDIRVVGFQVPEDRKAALAQFAGASAAAFTGNADELKAVLDRLVVPALPDAASISLSAPEPDPSYAFVTGDRLAVVRGTKVVAQTPGVFTSTYTVHYSADGHFVFAVTAAGISTLDVRSGAARVVPCGSCQDAVAAGGSVLSWLAGNVLTTLDLAETGARPRSVTTVLPDRKVDEPNQILPLRILAGREGSTLVSAPDGVSAYGGGAENLYLVRPGGQVFPLGTAQGNVAISGTTFSPDGRFAAYVAAGHAGACETRSSIVLLNLATGTHEETPPVGDPNDEGSGVDDVWYDKDGTLNMIYTSWRCDSSGGPRTSVTVPEGRWRLENSGWTQRDPSSAGYTRQVAPGFRAVLGDPSLQDYTRELSSEINGARTKISDNVRAIAVPD
ncbi:hypothetical protein VA596_25495 [Amycolatopsis sp., V23-08]|uniref:VWA domain-containing protein n=1 Tax=Amycolatopsis heterodermiae TaxID=3110235 RepID=A0ABU5R9K5_9PSEU|nr:hypothetical protein [Amycolatopsis sp., V23-08]MEA5362912.1 hypothetical protein [Amycolatopsis sp., V23-08]